MTFKTLAGWARIHALDRGAGVMFDEKNQQVIFEQIYPDGAADAKFDMPREVYNHLNEWCKKNARGEYEGAWLHVDNFVFRFADKREAMRFKLTWGGSPWETNS